MVEEQAISLTPREFAKARRNSGSRRWTPRKITLDGKEMRIITCDVVGVYYHRGPKVLCFIKYEL